VIAKKTFDAYAGAVDRAADACERAVRIVWDGLPKGDGGALRDALIEALPPVVAHFCDRAADAAAAFYEQGREAEWGQGGNARLSAAPADGQIERNVRFCMGYCFDGAPERTLSELQKTMRLHVQNAARETMMENMWRDDG